jgi:hypothetical protein
MLRFNGEFQTLKGILSIALAANGVAACSAPTSTWKEEVVLHDGRKLLVERSQTYGGRSEPGQSGPIREHRMRFMPPETNRSIEWESEYDKELGRTNFIPLALHVVNHTPYVVAYPNLCLSYRKWGRPNPPYVIFEYKNGVWKRIPLRDLPEQVTTVNLVLSTQRVQAEEMSRAGVVTADRMQDSNMGAPPELTRIVRTPLSSARIYEICP